MFHKFKGSKGNCLIMHETILSYIGKRVLHLANELGKIFNLFRLTVYWIFTRPVDYKNITMQMVEVGWHSFPVIVLTSLFTGMVFALQTGSSFKNIFNEPVFIGSAVGFALVKELSSVLTAIVIAGRIGASIAAELGTMKVTEQIDALYTLGTNPIKYLAVPRFLACITMIPLLTILSNVIGILGGLGVSVYVLRIPSTVYWEDIFYYMELTDFAHGIIKAFFFAAIIAVVSCYRGFSCYGGAEGVGKATTSAVMISIVLILVSDYFLAALLVAMGIG